MRENVMRLTKIQFGLWAAVVVALLCAVGLQVWTSPGKPADQVFKPDFSLMDPNGRMMHSADFRGKYQLVFFGFTNCPDVCPTTLAEVASVMDGLGADANLVQPIFISIDPARDRSVGLAAFTAAFHPAIIGLVGSELATKEAAASFKIYYERTDDAAAPNGYSMAHSPDLYLVGPEGDWLRLFPFGTPAADILADIQSRL